MKLDHTFRLDVGTSPLSQTFTGVEASLVEDGDSFELTLYGERGEFTFSLDGPGMLALALWLAMRDGSESIYFGRSTLTALTFLQSRSGALTSTLEVWLRDCTVTAAPGHLRISFPTDMSGHPVNVVAEVLLPEESRLQLLDEIELRTREEVPS